MLARGLQTKQQLMSALPRFASTFVGRALRVSFFNIRIDISHYDNQLALSVHVYAASAKKKTHVNVYTINATDKIFHLSFVM